MRSSILAHWARCHDNVRMHATIATATRLSLSIVGALMLTSCGTESTARIDPALASLNSREVADAMAGAYTNASQASASADFQSLVLHMRPIWVDRTDGLWLYVEQAQASSPESPYRQRVYQIVDGADAESVDCRVFQFGQNSSQFIGEWKRDRPLHSIAPALLVPLAGCTMTFHRDSVGSWIGTTAASECATSAHGAAYVVSEVTLTSSEFHSLDRGFNTSGVQVWGSAAGPYVFVKQSRR